MEGKFYAVIDTNVIVSAVISKSLESNPAKIIRDKKYSNLLIV